MHALLRFARHVLLGTVLVIVTIGILLQIPFVSSFVARTALRLANPWPGTSTALGSAGGSWFSSLSLTNVIIASPTDSLLISIDTLRASYDLTALAGGTLRFRDVYLARPIVRTRSRSDGALLFLEPFAPDTTRRDTSGGLKIRNDHLQVTNGEFALVSPPDTPIQRVEVHDFQLRADSILIGGGIEAVIETLHSRMMPDGKPGNEFQLDAGGVLSRDFIHVRSLLLASARSRIEAEGYVPLPFSGLHSLGHTRLRVSASPISYRDLHLILPGFGSEGEVRLDLVIAGKGDSSLSNLTLGFPGGRSVAVRGRSFSTPNGKLGLEMTGASERFSPSALTGMPDSTESVGTRFSVEGRGRTLEDFSGLLSAELLPSYLAGSGPLKGTVNARVDRGHIHATLRGEARLIVVNAEADLAPFEADPTYEVRGLVSVLHSRQSAHPSPRLEGLDARFTLSGHGMNPHTARAHAVVNGIWSKSPYFESLHLEGDFESDTVHAATHLVTASGSLNASVEAVLSETPVYRVHIPAFRSISLSSFGSGLPSSSLSGSLRAEARGTSVAALSGSAVVTLDTSEFENIRVRSMQTHVTINRSRLQISGRGESDAGSVALQGFVDRSADSLLLTLEQMDFHGIDLGKILRTNGMSSDLNGSMKLHAGARSVHDLSRMMQGVLHDGEGAIHANGLVRLDTSRFNRHTIQTAEVAMTFVDGRLESSVEMKTSAGSLKGNAQVRPFGKALALTVPALRFDHLNIGALTGNDSLRSDLAATVHGTFNGDSLEWSTGDLSIEFENSLANAALPSRGSLQVGMERGRFSLRGRADFAEGRAVLEGGGRLLPGGVQAKLSIDAAFSDSMPHASTAAVLPSGLQIRGSVEGRWGSLAETDLKGTLRGGGMLKNFQADTLFSDFSIRGRVLHVDTLRIITNAGSIIAGGSLTLFDSTSAAPSDFSLSASVTSLPPLGGAFGLDQALLHSANFSLHASGPPGRTNVHCATIVNMAATGGVALASLQGSADMRWGPSAVLESVEGKADIGGLQYGPLMVTSASVSVHSERSKYDIATLIRLGRGSMISLAGSVRDDSDSLVVLIDTLVLGSLSETWRLERQASITSGPRLVFRDFALHSGSRDFIVKGILDPQGESDFTVSCDSLNVENLGQLFGRPGLDGLIFADARVAGPAGMPRAVGDVTVALRDKEKDISRISAHLDWGARSLGLDGGIQEPGGGKLEAKAQIPVGLPLHGTGRAGNPGPADTSEARPLDVLITADKLNLDFLGPLLSPKVVNSLAGILTANIRARGTLDSIVADGVVSIDSGQIGIIPLGIVYSGIQVRCTAAGKDLHVEEIKATSGEGALRLSGLVSLQNPKKPAVDLKVTLERFVGVQTLDAKASVSGELLVKGEVATPMVTGNLVVNDSYFVLPEAGRLDSVEYVELTAEDYAMLQRNFGYTRHVAVAEKGPSAIEPTLDLTVQMQKNVWVRKRRNPTLAVELQGSVQIQRGPEGPPRINGTLRSPAGRSYVGQFGRQFELTEGEIVFKGALEDLEVHINSEYKVPSKGGTGLSEVVIRMKVERNLGRFVFSLTSDPAMDESEILSYLATGQSRSGALANTADQGGLAGAMALEQLVGVAGGLAEESMPLDVFQIRQDGARGITVVAGNYVSPKTYLGVRQPILFNQGTEDSYYDTRTQYELEYEARPWLFLNLQGGSSRTLLLLKARVAY